MKTGERSRGWAILSGVSLLYLALLIVFLSLMWDSRRNIDVVAGRLPAAMLSFETAIGYGGLIHNFKNHVLRTDEGIYGAATEADFGTAMQALRDLDEIAEEAGLDIPTAEIGETLTRYRDMIGAIDRANARGLPIDSIDELVRIPDEAALESLRKTHAELAAAHADQVADRQTQIMIMTAVISILMLLLPVSALTLLALKRRAERKYVSRIEALNSGLDRQNAKLETANHALTLANYELNEFAHAAAQDLRTPLRSIRHDTEYLIEQCRDRMEQDVTERLVHIQALCGRLDTVMTLLLRYARLAPPLRNEEVNPLSVIEEIEVGLAAKLAAFGGVITVETVLPPVSCRRFDLGMVFQNLIENALKYNNAVQKDVAVGFMPQADVDGEILRDVFFVRDNGIGIAVENHDEVFRMFRRLHHDDAFGPGAGAGLPFVKKIVENYGGVVRLLSEPGVGTSVYFSFTRQEAESTAPGDEQPTGTETLRAVSA